MSELEKLVTLFEQFPGIGPRQARRFVYFLLRADAQYRSSLVTQIQTLSQGVTHCRLCGRFISKNGAHCSVCADESRDKRLLMIVHKDADIEHFESSSLFKGQYLVLGGLIPLTQENAPQKTVAHIKARMQDAHFEECILALPVTTEGEHTREIITHALTELTAPKAIKITTLGRGLSTGAELEYTDKETLERALKTRF